VLDLKRPSAALLCPSPNPPLVLHALEVKDRECIMQLAVKADEVASGLTILIALVTIPSIRTLAKGGWRVKSPNHAGPIYEDVDGAATSDSIAEFTNTPQFITIFVLALLGLGISIADAIFTAVQEGFGFGRPGVPIFSLWLLVLAWVSQTSSQDRKRERTIFLTHNRYFCFCNSLSPLEKLNLSRDSKVQFPESRHVA
jgi:hypothetical protein